MFVAHKFEGQNKLASLACDAAMSAFRTWLRDNPEAIVSAWHAVAMYDDRNNQAWFWILCLADV